MSIHDNTHHIFANRFHVRTRLKSRHGVDTLLCADTDTGNDVVIKTIPADRLPPGMKLRIKHDILNLGSIQSAAIAPILDLGQEDEFVYLVRPFIKGMPLSEHLKKGLCSIRKVIDLGISMLQALSIAHEKDVLHRNIKPSNIIISNELSCSEASLVDFGLAHIMLSDSHRHKQAADFATYISPEQAGVLNQGVDERSDLYSVGVVLFECLAGKTPFTGDNLGEMLRKHLSSQPAQLNELRDDMPRVLNEVVQKLLRKNPRERYQSASSAIADLSEIAKALDHGISEPSVAIGAKDKRRILTEPAFIGRQAELSALTKALDSAYAGRGGLTLVEAESGGGKTRLLDEVALLSARRGIWVMRGQGTARSGQTPFQILDGVIGAVISMIQQNDGLAEEIAGKLGDQIVSLCAAVPQFANLFSKRVSDSFGPEEYGKAGSIAALKALFTAIGTQERPVVIMLDDCQWGDDLTMKLLAQWQPRQFELDTVERHTLFIAAFRSEEIAEGHALRNLNPSTHVRLSDFNRSDMRDMAESMAGQLPEQAIDLIAAISSGNPFMAVAVIEGMIEAEALIEGPDGWEIVSHAAAGLQIAGWMTEFLVRRIERLPDDIVKLLSIAAVLGKEFDLYPVAALAGQEPHELITALNKARQHRIVWADAQGIRYMFMHDKLRETFLQRLSDSELQRIHLAAAAEIEKMGNTRIFDLAYHFNAAGEYIRAFPYALAAAEQARSQHALDLAEEEYRIAERGLPADDKALRLRVFEGLGDALMLSGKYTESAPVFDKARLLADNRLDKARIEGKIGELASRRGENKIARAALERAIRLLDRPVPKGKFMAILFCSWEVVVQAMHTFLPQLFLARKKLEGSEEEFLAIRLYSRLVYAYFFHGDSISLLWAHLRSFNMAEIYPSTRELGMAYSFHGVALTALPYFSRALRYAERGVALQRSINDRRGEGSALVYYGLVLYYSSRYQEAVEKFQDALRILEKTGDRWETMSAMFNMSFCYYRMGNWKETEKLYKALYQISRDINDYQGIAHVFRIQAQVTKGDIPIEEVEEALQKPYDLLGSVALLQSKGIYLLKERHFSEAVTVLKKAWDMVKESGQRNDYIFEAVGWLSTALRLEIENISPYEAPRRKELIKLAKKVTREGLRISRKHRNHFPHVLREAGLLEAIIGRAHKAGKYLDESVAVAQELGAKYEYAQSLLARGRLRAQLGWDAAEKEVETANQIIASIEMGIHAISDEKAKGTQPVTLSLIDRYETVIEAGRKIASALSYASTFAAVREASLNLLRGEDCLVVEAHPDFRPQQIAAITDGIGDFALARDLFEQAKESRHPVVWKGEQANGGKGRHTLPVAIRSLLCAAIFLRGQVAGCFYVIHRRVEGLFGEEEKKLAQYISTLASVAMENTEGFMEMQTFSRTLERRVEERTLQLSTTNQELEDAIRKLRVAQEHLLQQAITDGLTGLFTRRFVTEWMVKEIESMNRQPGVLTCLLLDVDHFKSINDTYGHTEGDHVLQSVAKALKGCMRTSDIVGRYGGEEFIVLLPSTNHNDGMLVAERIRFKTEQTIQQPRIVTVSIGASTYVSPKSRFAQQNASDIIKLLIEKADSALYRAKAEGRNRVVSSGVSD